MPNSVLKITTPPGFTGLHAWFPRGARTSAVNSTLPFGQPVNVITAIPSTSWYVVSPGTSRSTTASMPPSIEQMSGQSSGALGSAS